MCACTLPRSARQAWNRRISPLKEQQPVKFPFTPLKESLQTQLQAERSWFDFSF